MNRQELFDKYLRNELSRQENAALQELIQNDPQAGKEFVAYIRETALFLRVGSQISLQPEAAGETGVSIARIPRRRAFELAAAACLLLTALVFSLWPRPQRGGEPYLAASTPGVEIVRAEAASGQTVHSLAVGDSPFLLHPGDRVRTTQSGKAVVSYNAELTRLSLAPGTEIKMGDQLKGKRVELLAGEIKAEVAPQPHGRPLLMITPQARATVLGTEFVLKTGPVTTQLDVLSGKVQFTCSFNSKKVLVTSGFTSISDSGGPSPAIPFSNVLRAPASNYQTPNSK